MTEPKTPLQDEKGKKASEILTENLPPDATTNDPEAPYGRFKNGKPRSTPPGSNVKKGGSAPKESEPEFNEAESMQQALFFLDMITNIRKGAGIEKPIPEITANAFVQSIPAMEKKYGAAVSKYMPEMMFFGSVFMITVDSIKELKIIREKDKEPKKDAKPKSKS